MIKSLRICSLITIFLTGLVIAHAQTSWTGNANTNWSNSANWTAGVPNSTTNAILGDANFTGANQPTVDGSSSCNSITIGGAVSTTLTLKKNLVVSGNFTLNANGSAPHQKSTLTVKGNWINNGTYTIANNSAKIIFGGTAQQISGSSATTFRQATINAGSTVTLATNVAVSGSGAYLYIYGTLNPGESPTYTLTSTVTFRVYENGKIKINAGTLAGNYVLSGSVTLYAGSIVEYASTSGTQTISSAYSYSTLMISGTGTKQLAANLPALNSSGATYGNIFVNSGTLDLVTYTANRGTSNAGGEINIANGAFLKIGGASNFPINFNTKTFSLASTVEYNGTAQTVSTQTYGNLILSSGSGTATKTMPGTAFTVEGNFTSRFGSGSSVTYTAASNITFNGNVDVGASTTFNGSSFVHTCRGNWVNNGAFTGSTGTVSFDAPSLIISGSGTHNFNNIHFLRSGISAASGTSLNVSGNIATTGSGQFTHGSGGMITITGVSKTITGADMIFNDITISGSITCNTSFTINGNLIVPGTFSASSGTILMTGIAKTISGAGAIGFSILQVTGTITTTSNFAISVLLNIDSAFTATAGTATFTGTSKLSGAANLYNVTLNGTSLQLDASSILGIANVFTLTAGTLNVTGSTPNTVIYNGANAQVVNALTYHNLTVSNGNTKTASGNLTINGNFTIFSGTAFTAGSYTHTILRDWVNNGTFTASTSTVQFTGVNNATLTGATTFNNLTINKSSATTKLTLVNDIIVSTVNMTNGRLLTAAFKITINTTRTGSGIILGTITRTHAYTTGISYAFEGPENTINFTAATAVTSVTVIVNLGGISDFPDNSSVNREYNITVTGTSYNAALRLHYEDAELNGNNEATLELYKYSGSWASAGSNSINSTSNYIELTGLANINYRWAIAQAQAVVRWNGSVSSNWSTAANWTAVSGGGSTPPATTDIVQIGTAIFTNQPTISSAVSVKGISFGSAQAATITLASGGSLTCYNIGGIWTADAVHTIAVQNQTLTVNGNANLSNGLNNRLVNLTIGTGTVSVFGDLLQKANASIIFSGAGNLNIGGNFYYTSGTFTAAGSTVTYNGNAQQDIASIPYNNLVVNKATGDGSVITDMSIAGNLSVQAGVMDITNAVINVGGNISISSGATLDCNVVSINVAGNWTNNGTYLYSSGTVVFNGTGPQSISAGFFNNLTFNKTSGTATLTGNNTIVGNLNIQSGTIDLSTFTINRLSNGGTFSMSSGTILLVNGADNFPLNYSVFSLNSNSTVIYNGTVAQTIRALTYGNLTISNGGSNAKTQVASTAVAGNMFINSGATFHSGGFSTLLSGNWTNNGTYTATTGLVVLNGISKTINGNTIFNRLTVNGSYTVAGSDITINGSFFVAWGASYTAGSGIATVSGDLTNAGTLTSTGTTNFTGTSVQNIRLLNALSSSSTGVVNFNGTVSPVMLSTSTPQFATLNINNTAGINPSVDWSVFVAMNVNTGGKFNGGLSTHTIFGSFANTGTVTSTGTIQFTPATTTTIALGNLGFSSAGIVKFGGAGQVTITGNPGVLNNVIISNTNSAGVTMSSNLTIDSNFIITAGATFKAGSFNYIIKGNINCDGVLIGESSTVTMTGPASELSVSAEAVFNHFVVNGSLTPQTDFRVAGNFTNNGVYDGSMGVLIMSGGNASSIGGTTTPSIIAQLTIEKTSNAIVTQNVNITDVLFLNIFSGILFTSTYSLLQDAGGGIMIVNDDATLRLGGTNGMLAFSGGIGLAENSTVDYSGIGTAQSIGNTAIYGNLLISGAGIKTTPLGITVVGNLIMTNGTLATATTTLTHKIAGNFIMTGSSAITGSNATYQLNGFNDQTITLLSNLVRLTINKFGGNVVLGSDITVITALAFTKGKIQTGNYKIVIPDLGTVTGASQTTGWVNGRLQKNYPTGSAVSQTFETGGTNYYSPCTVVFANISTTGDLITKASILDHPESDYSGIDTTKSVNRYWTLTNSGIVFTTAAATFNWNAADVDAGAITANFKTARFNSTSWAITTMASPLSTSIQATGLTAFGDFIVGELQSVYKWTGENFTSTWTTAKNWSGGVPTSTTDMLIPSGLSGGRVYPVLNSGTAAVNNITIQSAASLTVSGAVLQIAGSITNSGTFTVDAGTIEFNGITAQIIPTGSFLNNTVKNLIISSNVSLSGTVKLTGTLNIAAGKTFTTNNNLVIKSDATGTARIATLPVDGLGIATAFITGNVSIERYIPARYVWRLLAAPLKTTGAPTINAAWQEGVTTASGTPNPNPGYGTHVTGGTVANGFDQSLTNGSSIKYYNNAGNNTLPVSSTNIPITNYSGYFLFVRGDRGVDLSQGTSIISTNTTLRMQGQVVTGNQAIAVNATNKTLIGNPFPSAIDFGALTKTNVANTIYIWDPKLGGNYGVGGYVTGSWNSGTSSYDFTSANSPVSQYIPSGGAFFVNSANGTSSGTLTIKEADKSTGGNDQVFGIVNTVNPYLRVDMFGKNVAGDYELADGLLATFNDNNNNDVDVDDAKKMINSGENITLRRQGELLSIERRKMISVYDTLFINLARMKQKDYRFEINTNDLSVSGNMICVLKDKLAGSPLNDMLLNSTGQTFINFTVNADSASFAANRFSIVFRQANTLPVVIRKVSANQQNKDIIVNWQTENEVNILDYEVELSTDGRTFVKGATVAAKATQSAEYNWTDISVSSGTHYYRIRANGTSGIKYYSSIVKVNVSATIQPASAQLIPNFVTGSTLTLQLNNTVKQTYQVFIFNSAGQLIQQQSLAHLGGIVNYNISLNAAVAGGRYYLQLSGESEKINLNFIKP